MSPYFAQPQETTLAPGIQKLAFEYEHTEIGMYSFAPGTAIEPQQGEAMFFGLVVEGRAVFESGQRREELTPLHTAFRFDPGISYSIANPFDEPAVVLGIQRSHPDEFYDGSGDMFLSILEERTWKMGLQVSFFVTPWFEIMVNHLPPGGAMPTHTHRQEQFGVVLTGRYMMAVGDEQHLFERGKTYHAPSFAPHGGNNPFDQIATSVNLFFPPRYHRVERPKPLSAEVGG